MYMYITQGSASTAAGHRGDPLARDGQFSISKLIGIFPLFDFFQSDIDCHFPPLLNLLNDLPCFRQAHCEIVNSCSGSTGQAGPASREARSADLLTTCEQIFYIFTKPCYNVLPLKYNAILILVGTHFVCAVFVFIGLKSVTKKYVSSSNRFIHMFFYKSFTYSMSLTYSFVHRCCCLQIFLSFANVPSLLKFARPSFYNL
jgi:hypothetical protein